MYYLGVDGGGSGCRAVLADATGQILGRGAAGPANVFSNPQGALENVLTASAQAMAGVCAPAEVIAALGLAGVNVAGDGLAQELPFARARIESDVVIAIKGALGDAPGIVATIGTGSVFARQQGSELRVIGGWGLTLGDEGSGAWLGRALCARALLAIDGFTEKTPLLAELVTDFGGPQGIVGFAARATPADFAALAPRVAGLDDPAALALMDA
ncbi:BadF/BadG/BcrA/BcrD ATPase family protein, partial [Phaeovulum sp.]|uniref:BadF/BadG/BcrA/BcrD ATPase family protein n=1 Tax=Phaeovulum sp. TaxID=2934796 RepID=UPI00356354F1